MKSLDEKYMIRINNNLNDIITMTSTHLNNTSYDYYGFGVVVFMYSIISET